MVGKLEDLIPERSNSIVLEIPAFNGSLLIFHTAEEAIEWISKQQEKGKKHESFFSRLGQDVAWKEINDKWDMALAHANLALDYSMKGNTGEDYVNQMKDVERDIGDLYIRKSVPIFGSPLGKLIKRGIAGNALMNAALYLTFANGQPHSSGKCTA